MSAKPDLDRVAAVIAEVAASEVMSRFGRTTTTEKTGPQDIVTEADGAAERALAPRLLDCAPGAIVGEEAVSANETLYDALKGEGSAWVIDPVDGTLNFAAALPLFGVMVAYVTGGDTVAAWIHDPVRKVTAMAERGSGAWLSGKRLRTAAPASLAHMHGAASIRHGDRELCARIGRHGDRIASFLSLRCAAQEYLALLEGKTHFCFYHRTYAWDHAPGCLIAREAGATTRRLDGSEYRAGDAVWASPLLVTANEESWGWVKSGLLDA